jgi:hypothetical protein
MKFKLIRSNFDEQTGVSSATIATDLGFFTGYAQLAEEDKAVASTFCGCRYAELRAILKYIKKRISLYSHKIQTLNNYFLYLKSRKDFDEESVECKKLYKYINHIKKEKDMWQGKKTSLEAAIFKNIKERDVALQKLNKIHLKK